MTHIEKRDGSEGGAASAGGGGGDSKDATKATGWLPSRIWNDRNLAILYANVALYALCYQMQTPMQLALVKSLVDGGSEEARTQFAWVKSVNGVAQLGGSLVAGVLVDAVGVRNVMLLSFLASFASYAMVASATSVGMLYLAQAPTIFQHAVLAARAQVALTLSDAERPQYLGYVGFAYGIGFVVGPALGGLLSTYSLTLSAALAAGLTLVSIALTLSTDDVRGGARTAPAATAAADGASSSRARWSLDGYARVLRSPGLLFLLVLKSLFSFALAIFHATFNLVADERFGLDAAGVGFLMSFVGAVGMIAQAVLVRAATVRWSERTIGVITAAALAACFGAYGLVHSTTALYALMVPLVAFNTVFQVVNTAQIAREAPDDLKGTLVAVDMAIFSSMRIWTPAVGSMILTAAGHAAVAATSSSACAGMLVLLLLFNQATPAAAADAAASKAE